MEACYAVCHMVPDTSLEIHINTCILTHTHTILDRLECTKIFHSAYLRTVLISAPYYSMVKMSIGASVVCYVLLNDGQVSPRSVFIVIGYYNILRLDVGWLLPFSVQQLSEISVSMRRIQVLSRP